MKKATRIGLGTVLLFAVLAAGFSSGYWYFRHENVPRTNNVATPTPSPAQKADATPPSKQKPYMYYKYSPPSVGILLHKKAIDLPKGTFFPILVLPPEQAAQYTKGQKIIFYDDQDTLLDMIGEVADIFPAKERGKTAVLIGIRTLDSDLVNKFTKAYVAMDVERDVARLPTSAIIKGEDGRDYVWELENESGGMATAFLKGIIVKSRHEGYVVVQPGASSSNDYITDPDENLTDGAMVRIEQDYFEGPAIAESDMIAEKIDAGFAERQKRFRQEQDAIKAANSPSRCAPAQSVVQDFIEKARMLGQGATTP